LGWPHSWYAHDNKAAFLSVQELENQPSYPNPATLLTYKNSTWLKYMLEFFLQKPKKTIKKTSVTVIISAIFLFKKVPECKE
jgi:hypothetical protein